MTAINVRDVLQNNTTLNAYWTDNYGKLAQHYIGYKYAQCPSDLPTISYVVPRKTRANDFQDSYLISLVIQIHNDVITDNVFEGVTQLEEIEDIITTIFDPYTSSDINVTAWIEGDITITSDMQTRHPYHEMEIQFNLMIQRSL